MDSGHYVRSLKPWHLLGDVLILSIAYITSFVIRFDSTQWSDSGINVYFYILSLIAWVAISIRFRLYSSTLVFHTRDTIRHIFKAGVIFFLLLCAIVFLFKLVETSRIVLVLYSSISLVLLAVWRIGFQHLLRHIRPADYRYTPVAIIGAGPLGIQFYEALLSNPNRGLKFVGFYDDYKTTSGNGFPILGTIEEFKTNYKNYGIKDVYVALPGHAASKIRDLISFAENNLLHIRIVPDFGSYINRKVNIDFVETMPVVYIRKEPLSRYTNRVIKRLFDVFFSSFIIVFILSWVLPILAIIIKLDSRGPIFFKQLRNGEEGREFLCIKLRSMRTDNPDEQRQASRNDDRITRVGRFIRKTNLDELPQFFNVLFGEMSIVGPRPHMVQHNQLYAALIDTYQLRHMVKPGITGWAQVRGFRGETKNADQMRRRVICDVWYMENWSIFLDIYIILLTGYRMVAGDRNAF